jgi:hypothetical protein
MRCDLATNRADVVKSDAPVLFIMFMDVPLMGVGTRISTSIHGSPVVAWETHDPLAQVLTAS